MKEHTVQQLAKMAGVSVRTLHHYDHIGLLKNFFDASAEVYRGLGELYVEDEWLRAYHEKYRAGLVDYLRQAIEYCCYKALEEKQHTNYTVDLHTPGDLPDHF